MVDVQKNKMIETMLSKPLSLLEKISPDITEIMLNSDGILSYELSGSLEYSDISLEADEATSLIRGLAGFYNLIVDKKNPSLSVRLPVLRGGRFQGNLPPVVQAPIFSIRIPPRKIFTVEDLLSFGTITPENAEVIIEALSLRKNVILAGGTSTGKTTIANAFLSVIQSERVFVIEDNPEIKLQNNKNTEYMLTSEHYTLRDAVFDCMRLRPDRIIVGEIRDGGTAVDLLKAWITGHPGLATIHASSAKEVDTRLYTLMQEVLVTPDKSLIQGAVDLIIFLEKVFEGGRFVRKVTGMVKRY